jgi:hypothetical protein
MQNEPDLPPELADIETQLRQLSLPDARVNREQLFYQAGWSAARASVAAAPSLLWPVTSGVLAAAVVVLVVFGLRTPPTVETVAEATAPTIEQPVEQPAEPRVEYLRPTYPYRHRVETAPLLALRERALRGEFSEPTLAVSQSTSAVPMTARELMQEFLPEAERSESTSPAATPSWPWQRIFGSETI